MKEQLYKCDECGNPVRKDRGGFYVRRTLSCLMEDGLVMLMIVPAIEAFHPEDYDHHLCCRGCLTKHVDGVAQSLEAPKEVAA